MKYTSKQKIQIGRGNIFCRGDDADCDEESEAKTIDQQLEEEEKKMKESLKKIEDISELLSKPAFSKSGKTKRRQGRNNRRREALLKTVKNIENHKRELISIRKAQRDARLKIRQLTKRIRKLKIKNSRRKPRKKRQTPSNTELEELYKRFEKLTGYRPVSAPPLPTEQLDAMQKNLEERLKNLKKGGYKKKRRARKKKHKHTKKHKKRYHKKTHKR